MLGECNNSPFFYLGSIDQKILANFNNIKKVNEIKGGWDTWLKLILKIVYVMQ